MSNCPPELREAADKIFNLLNLEYKIYYINGWKLFIRTINNENWIKTKFFSDVDGSDKSFAEKDILTKLLELFLHHQNHNKNGINTENVIPLKEYSPRKQDRTTETEL